MSSTKVNGEPNIFVVRCKECQAESEHFDTEEAAHQWADTHECVEKFGGIEIDLSKVH